MSGSSDEETEKQQNKNSQDPEPEHAGASQNVGLPASQGQSKTDRTWTLDRGVGFRILGKF